MNKNSKNLVFNPETKRYIKRDSKKGIEILFKNKDKEILNSYELINGKIVKKCPNGKIRNPKTLRCATMKKEPMSSSMDKKKKAITKIIKAFSPFVNRVSADVYVRNRYLMMVKREIKEILKTDNGCLKIYKINPDETVKYRIGNNIILKKRIGSKSAFGEAYISEFRDKSKKLLTFVTKIYRFDEKKTPRELKLLELLTNKVRMDLCPHFPITYGSVMCNKIRIRMKDNFIQSNSKEKPVKQNWKYYPNIVKDIYFNNGKMISLFNELANGDLKNFFQVYSENTELLINSYVQNQLSILFYYYHTDMAHNDCHWGNFLYHKIKKGGYFHYKIFDKDYYLENLGFLWVIWDFDASKEISIENTEYDMFLMTSSVKDFALISEFYFPNEKKVKEQIINGFNVYIWKQLNDNKIKFLNQLNAFSKLYIQDAQHLQLNINWPKLINFLKYMLKYFEDVKWLLTELPKDAKVINKNPYVIKKEFINRH